MSKIQKQGVKTEAEVVSDGGTAADLINDTQIYVSANSINKTLDDAIVDGDIGGMSLSSIVRGGGCTKGGSSSGDTTVVNFANAISSTGSDITFTARTSTTGDLYTINTTGVYSLSASITDGSNAQTYGFSVNSSGTSTVVQSLAASEVPLIFYAINAVGGTGSVTVNLTSGDIVRLQSESGGSLSAGNTNQRFAITRVG